MRRLSTLLLLLLCWALPLAAQDDAPLPLYALPDPAQHVVSTSTTAALTAAGRVVTVNPLLDTVSIVEPLSTQIAAEITVDPEPFSVAITPDSMRALVVSRAGGSLSVIDLTLLERAAHYPLGEQPFAVVAADNASAYVSLLGEAAVLRLDLADGRVLERIETPAEPAGLALWGDFLYVTHFWSGQLSLIYRPDAAVVRTIDTAAGAGFAPSLSIDARAGLAYLPQSISNPDARLRTAQNTLIPAVQVIDLATFDLRRDQRLLPGLSGPLVNAPYDTLLDVAANRLYVAQAGSSAVSVIDLSTGLAIAHVPVGQQPRSLLFSRDGLTVYVHDAFDATLSMIETRFFSTTDALPVSSSSPPFALELGARLFYGADDPRLSAGAVSCANCHEGGLSDGRAWNGRITPALRELPVQNWADWDGLNDHIRDLQGGAGFVEDDAQDAMDRDALVAYLLSLSQP